MTSTMAPRSFFEDLHQRVQLDAEREEAGHTAAFTEYMISVLTGAGEIDDGDVALFSARGMAASGYSVSDDGTTVDILVSDYEWSDDERSFGKIEVASHFRRVAAFAERCLSGRLPEMEDSLPAWEMSRRLADDLPSAEKLRLTLVTNAHVRGELPSVDAVGTLRTSVHLWDIDRLYRLETSGAEREPISVDLVNVVGDSVPFLGPKGVAGDYEAYLMLIPGEALARVYEQYGARLLELNVRSFLQARGKVNRGIQQTIQDEPRRFLAYNNGISMTASAIHTTVRDDGQLGITRIDDLQIVNGGQTTASLYYARSRAKPGLRPLEGIFVQAKLSVVPADRLTEIVPRISEYANSQNTVKVADFSANDPFHVSLEAQSRTVWAPDGAGASHSTRWFYERARGQYADAIAKEGTRARQQQFKTVHPLAQKFTKTDVAKFELTWAQRPEVVSLGAEKCFREFMLLLEDRKDFRPDKDYFELLVAKGLLFRRTEKIISALGLGGYRAQAVTYTLALMSKRTAQQIDLGQIWRQQDVSPELADAIGELGARVHAKLVSSAGQANVTEWAKKPEAWAAVQKLEWEAANLKLATNRSGLVLEEVWTDEARAAALRVLQVHVTGWDSIVQWGQRSKSLDAGQRKLCNEMRKKSLRNDAPTPKEAVALAAIIDLAEGAGFSDF